MKRFYLCIALFFAFSTWAQEQNDDSQNEGEALDTDFTEEQLAAAENNELVLEGNEGEEEESNSRFIPTEQISQDSGVAFPVDI